MEIKPYNIVKVKGKKYYDYSIKINNIIYDISFCDETKVLDIRKDEY
jgi:hypothetical protein